MTTILMQLLGVAILSGTIFAAIRTTNKNPDLKTLWTFVGFLMFLSGMIMIVVNMVGIYYGFLAWIEDMGRVGSFLFKLGLIFGGVAIVTLVRYDEEAHDEYFDGNKYQD